MSTLRAPASLTTQQAAAVASDEPRILLVAPAGSGKTEVLIRRIVRLLSDSQGETHRILAVTYTRKAADNLRARIAAALSDEVWRVQADTLHGFALDWLRRYGDIVGVGPDVVVYSDDHDRIAIIERYLSSLTSDVATVDVRELLRSFDDQRARCLPLPAAHPLPSISGIPTSELYEGYVRRLTDDGGIDFPGMLTKLIDALDLDEWVGNHFRSLYQHVLVDEGQDLSRAQSELLDRLVRDDLSLFVVADDRQSINSFAGGSFENARELVQRRGESITLRLHHSFRCSTRILTAAEGVAQQLAEAPPVAHAAEDAPPGSIVARACRDPADEADVVADWIEHLLKEGLDPADLAAGEDTSIEPEDIAVVGRTRWVLDPLVAELSRRGRQIAMQVEASDFLEFPEGRIILDALSLETNAEDRPAARRIGEELGAIGAQSWDGDIVDTLASLGDRSLEAIAAAVNSHRRTSDLEEFFGILAGVDDRWERDAGRLVTLWRAYRSETALPDRTAAGFLRFVARVQRARPTDPGVRVMTIHRVKGLEFRAVAAVGAREGTLPDYRAKTRADLDAERRSFYVAMTRAARDLLITWPHTTVDRYGGLHHQQPSRFLRDAGLVGPG